MGLTTAFLGALLAILALGNSGPVAAASLAQAGTDGRPVSTAVGTPVTVLPITTPTAGPVLSPIASPPASATASTTPSPTARPYTGVPVRPPPTIIYTDTAIPSVAGLWLGRLNTAANIRRGPGTAYPVDRAWQAGRRVIVYGQTAAPNGELWDQVARYPEPDLYVWSGLVSGVDPLQVPTTFHPGRWIDVNLTQQMLIAFDGAQPVMVAQIASGKAGHETPVGSWRIYWRLAKQDMDGGDDTPGNRYYNLKDVPWVQYFQNSGVALHGTYWHDNFGTPMSHGCVNLSDWNALWLYQWASRGTLVQVHY